MDILDTELFYEIMQRYRHSGALRGGHESDVSISYEHVKDFIRYYFMPQQSKNPNHDGLTSEELNKRFGCQLENLVR